MFDGANLSDHHFNGAGALRQPSPGSASSNNDRHFDAPASFENLQQHNTWLRTRVSELEVINSLYQGHVQQNNRQEHHLAPQAEMMPQQETETSLRELLEQSKRREEDLTRQVEELKREVSEMKEEQSEAKRTRRTDTSEYPEPST